MTSLQLRSLVTASDGAGGTVEVSLAEVPDPEPGPGQVLVRMEAAPINPSDLGLLFAGADVTRAESGGTAERPTLTAPLSEAATSATAARYGQSLPVGNEGAGTVIAAGVGAEHLIGRVVAIAGGATYAQLRTAPADQCLVLPEGTEAAAGAASFVNPMTVVGMIETMRAEGHSAIVHTAAGSNLGHMLLRACAEDDIPLVNVVRSDAAADELRAAGAQHVCVSTSDGFTDDLRAAITATGATLAFDATGGGRLADQILSAMEASLSAGQAYNRYGSTTLKQVYLYGSLDMSATELRRSYGMAWAVGGWLLPNFLMRMGADADRLRQRVADGLTTTFASRFTDEISLVAALDPATAAAYDRRATGQKYLIRPQA